MIDITKLPLSRCRADLFDSSGALAENSISVLLESLDDPLVRVRLASIFESVGNRSISASVADQRVVIRTSTGVSTQPRTAGLPEVESMRPGELRQHINRCLSWWEERLRDERDMPGFFSNVSELDANEIALSVEKIVSSPKSMFVTFGARWIAEFFQTIASSVGGRVIHRPGDGTEHSQQSESESQRLALLNDHLLVLPTWSALDDLSQNHRVMVCGSRSAIALHAEAIIASGVDVEVDDNPSDGVIPAGHTLRQSLNDLGGAADLYPIPALSAPAQATVNLLGRSRSKSSEPAVLVWAPPYRSSSGGIRILYRLAESLSERGFLAGIMPVGPRKLYGRIPADFADGRFLLAERDRRLVHIQPETLSIEVSDAPRIMWELYFRGRLPFSGGLAFESESKPDRIITHSRSYSVSDERLYLCPIDFETFRPLKGTQRDHILLYLGKAELSPSFQIPRRYRNLNPTVIHRTWPSRPVLSQMLQTAKLLISFDPFSALNAEATVCGCPVLIDTRFADSDATEALHRYEFGLEGFHIDGELADVSPIQQPIELWERLRHETAKCESNDLNRFVELTLPEILRVYE